MLPDQPSLILWRGSTPKGISHIDQALQPSPIWYQDHSSESMSYSQGTHDLVGLTTPASLTIAWIVQT